ncbi:hypothetical protein INT48_001202 [Thamnidium elegans]|uniref:Uncharacterized protein n=1 Tax=Thamnidium elegans TaxID=101142 RepID=A0A8H7SKG5_9FUNG|nr:hypothetical protein INT48_001202 [Thamnidium elegans]
MAATNKSCYRLYAGHGNWVNLSPKTTQDLLQIFEEGIPCRYKLSDGIFIDIIPHDVDCNSKNIDMFGLMRADLVYETQVAENHVQQLMSHYIRSILDDQGIIDAFPPLRSGEDLPIITSIPTHRHLSLVPSVVGAVRRGPKPATLYKQALSVEDVVMLSSSSASSSPPNTARITKKKESYMHSKRSSKRNQANIVELIQQKRPQVNIPDNSSQNNNQLSLFDGHHSSNYMDNAYPVMSYSPPPHNNPWSYHRQVSSGNATQNTNFSFDFDFDQGHTQRQSPTDILHEYEYQRFDNATEMYPTHTLIEEKPIASPNDSTDSYVPNSPHHWGRGEWDYQQGKLTTTTTATTAKSDSPQEGQFFKIVI